MQAKKPGSHDLTDRILSQTLNTCIVFFGGIMTYEHFDFCDI